MVLVVVREYNMFKVTKANILFFWFTWKEALQNHQQFVLNKKQNYVKMLLI